jgi:hypothetical protein
LSIHRRLKKETRPSAFASGRKIGCPSRCASGSFIRISFGQQAIRCLYHCLKKLPEYGAYFCRIHGSAPTPDIPVYVLLVDRVENKFDPDEEPYHVITLEELG